MTLSAGVAGGQGEVLRLDALVRDADAALYSAKALGRNQVYVFRETGDDGTIRRAPITAEARVRAIDVGKAAMAAAQDALIATLAGRPAWAGKPSTMIADASVAIARAIDLPDGRAGADPHGEPPPRPRQARDPRGDPRQARRPRGVRVAGRDRAPEDRPGRAGAGRRAARRGDDRPPPPRVVRRPRLSPRARRRRDPGRGADRVDRGRLRGDGRGPAVPGGDLARGRDRRAAPAGRRPVRSRSSSRCSPRCSRRACRGT